MAAFAAGALAPAAVYRWIDATTEKPTRGDAAAALPVEQHLLQHLQVVRDDGVEVIVPPLHHRVVTARVTSGLGPAALRDARQTFEHALAQIERDYPLSPAGLGITVAWGLPYFRRYVPSQARREIPIDVRASAARRRTVRVLEDAERFPSDPERTSLEKHDVAILLRSDRLEAIEDAQRRLFDDSRGLFAPTSVRSGFIGGGFGGDTALPKQLAMRARVPGAHLIPATAELFLGFTSTVKHAQGPSKIANFETLGYAKLRNAYFVGGTHMHLSHLFENVNAWYVNFDHAERVTAMFHSGIAVESSAQTVKQDATDVQTATDVRADYRRRRRIGHAGAMQPASRLQRSRIGRDGTVYPKGTAVPQRADFNTLDNPFTWSAHPIRDRIADTPAAGTHFVVFNPTADDFRRIRLAMDGILPGGVRLNLPPRSIGQGINSVFHATHRQNFLVPPRAHRSFPLSELRP
jgi:deferrochelatase/peroxidase EfeB